MLILRGAELPATSDSVQTHERKAYDETCSNVSFSVWEINEGFGAQFL